MIVFEGGRSNPIIHRVISINENQDGTRTFSTLGDNNQGQISFEKEIQENQVIGKAAIRILPSFGWVKLIFFEGQRSSQEKGFCEERQ